MEVNQEIQLFPHQAEAFYYLLDTDIREFWQVGGFGVGKSLLGCKLCEEIAMRHKGIRIAMIRDTLENFKKTSLNTFLEVVDSRLYEHNKSEKYIRFKNGSEAYYFGLDDTGAIARLQSFEPGFLWVDEVDGVAERVYNIATKRLRQKSPSEKQLSKDFLDHCKFAGKSRDDKLEFNMFQHIWKRNHEYKPYPRKVLITSNSAGQNWTWHRFVEEPYPLTKWNRAISSANSELPKEYLESLEELKESSPEDYKRFVMAEFNIFEGQIYKEFNEATHIVDPFDIPTDWERVAFMDYGLRNHTAIGLFAIAPDGKCYMYDEYYEQGQPPIRHCEWLLSRNFDMVTGDPSMMNKNQAKGDYIYAISDEYEEQGVSVAPAQNNHEAGRSYVKKMLREGNLLFFRNCVNAIRTLPAIKWKAPRIIKGVEIIDEDEAQGQEDHLPDVIRYFCMERCSPRATRATDDQLWEADKMLRNPLLPMKKKKELEELLEREESMMEMDEQSYADDDLDW